MKTKTYATMEAAIAFAKDTLGMRCWDDYPDCTDYAPCWESLGSGKKIATVTRKGKRFKLSWDPQYEKRKPKMVGL